VPGGVSAPAVAAGELAAGDDAPGLDVAALVAAGLDDAGPVVAVAAWVLLELLHAASAGKATAAMAAAISRGLFRELVMVGLCRAALKCF
jgi:hypothetical protein